MTITVSLPKIDEVVTPTVDLDLDLYAFDQDWEHVDTVVDKNGGTVTETSTYRIVSGDDDYGTFFVSKLTNNAGRVSFSYRLINDVLTSNDVTGIDDVDQADVIVAFGSKPSVNLTATDWRVKLLFLLRIMFPGATTGNWGDAASAIAKALHGSTKIGLDA